MYKIKLNSFLKFLMLILCIIGCFLFGACGRMAGTDDVDIASESFEYGAFQGLTEDLEQLDSYKTVVIDAQYFSSDEIKRFRDAGHKVFSYINVGSLEDFRPYYNAYEDLALGSYEHWDEEVWINVADDRWQSFILNDLAKELLDKGIDGFFVDNCDVYYVYPEDDVLNGLSVIMKGLASSGKEVIINGGNCFLDAYCNAGGRWNEVITGINQESVFSTILWDSNEFGASSEEDREYFIDYVKRYGDQGADIYLLEYTTDEALIKEIDRFCAEHGYKYYVSDDIECDMSEND